MGGFTAGRGATRFTMVGGTCNGTRRRDDAITAGGGEVLQGFQAVGRSCPNVGVVAHWRAAVATVRTIRGRVWNVLLYPLKRCCFDTVKNIY